MRVLIENYRNLPAAHCGSGAMRNLIYHYCDLELDEAVVFGLGSGLDCMFFGMPDVSPPFMLFGRSISMEQDLAAALGIDYRETAQPDDNLAWQEVRQEIAAGHPTMLSGDIYYLDYRKFKVHFPSHRFVMLGFDDEKLEVYVADRTECETQTCSMQALRLSRNPPVGISTYNLWGKFQSATTYTPLAEACGLALRKTVERMQGIDNSQAELLQLGVPCPPQTLASGLAGIELLANDMQGWSQQTSRSQHADYLVSAIVKFGTGGAMFRNLYADFLQWAQRQRPELVDDTCVQLARQSARQWDCLAEIARPLTEREYDAAQWQLAQRQVLAAHETEHQLFGRLAEAVL